MMRKIAAVWLARNKEFYRDRGTMAWNLLFPLLAITLFGYAFSGKPQPLYKVGVLGPVAIDPELLSIDYVELVKVESLDDAIEKVRRHRFDLVLASETAGGEVRYWVNDTSPKGYSLERILRGSLATPARLKKETVTGEPIRYVHWLIPGILGMNMMFSALFGVGYVIVRYRKNGMLKRLRATPLRPFEFLAAQIASRLMLILTMSTLLFLGFRLLVPFPVTGSYAALFVLAALGATSLISLGLLVAARVSSEEVAGGLLNVLSWPMMFLSGVWFSLEGANPWILGFVKIFPLTHLIDGARAVILDGAGFPELAVPMAVLAGMSALFLALGSTLFRWQ